MSFLIDLVTSSSFGILLSMTAGIVALGVALRRGELRWIDGYDDEADL
jgi:hypothetical protein